MHFFRASQHEFEITVQTIVKVRAVWHSLESARATDIRNVRLIPSDVSKRRDVPSIDIDVDAIRYAVIQLDMHGLILRGIGKCYARNGWIRARVVDCVRRADMTRNPECVMSGYFTCPASSVFRRPSVQRHETLALRW